MPDDPASIRLIVGCGHPTDGLHAVEMNPADGRLSAARSLHPELADLTFLVGARDSQRLYAVSEGPGEIIALRYAGDADRVEVINRQPVQGGGPCHLALNADENLVVVATYNGGTVETFPLDEDGALQPRRQLIQHEGTGPNPDRQESPHVHSITFSPDQRFAYACDLTRDEVLVYELGAGDTELTPRPERAGRVPPGSGPRHARISRDGRFLYALNELRGSVSIFARNITDGSLQFIENVPATVDGIGDDDACSELCLMPHSERFLFAASRGPNCITTFLRDPATGGLTGISAVETGGQHPRNFALSPDGRWLVCANRFSHELRSFAVASLTGAVIPTGHHIALPEPCCVHFAR